MPGLYDDDDDYGQESPKALRDAYEKLKKQLEAKDKELEAERKTNQDLTKKVKSTTLRDALTDAGIDPKYVRFAERDEVEATPESVKKWVDENAEVYAFLKPKSAPTGDDDGEGEQDPGLIDELPADLAAQILAAQRVESAGRPSGSTAIEQVLEQTDPSQFKSQAEINAYLAKLGAPVIG